MHVGHEPGPESLVGRDEPAREDHLLREAHRGGPRQALGPAPSGDDAQARLGLAEAGTLGGDAHVAGQRDLAASAERVAVHRGHHRLRSALDAIGEQLGPAARSLLERAGRPHVPDVGPGAEGLLAGPGATDRAERRILLDLPEPIAQLIEHLRREGVERLRSVEGQNRDRVAALDVHRQGRLRGRDGRETQVDSWR